jgi:protein-L-isoaspartate(D-aspartate) O-methyltransferase
MSGSDDAASERARLAEQLATRERVDEATLDALRSVPRHEFVPGAGVAEAYADRPLPIGAGQTVSAPHMVAVMTSLLDVGAGDDVLEVGTGCGYHAAVTATVVDPGTVYSVEYEPSLAEAAGERLDRLGYDNVAVRRSDGADGWSAHAPYDAAYLTCAPDSVPDAVVEQVRAGGRVVAPVGGTRQVLVRLTPTGTGVDRETFGGVRFVRMQ